MAPTTKTLEKRGFDPETARKVRALLDGSTEPEAYESVQRWIGQCYNRPSDDELMMEALNEVLGGFGVEAIRGRYVDSYHTDHQACYVNMGDTYDLTILLDHETGRFYVASWGDWVEANNKHRQLI